MVFSTLCRPRMGISPAPSAVRHRTRLRRPARNSGLTGRVLLNHSGAACGERRKPHADRVVGIQHGEIARPLRLEQASFRRGIFLERVMPVEMVWRDIQRHPDVRPKLGRWFPAGNWKAPARSTGPGRERSIIAVTGVPILPPTCTAIRDSAECVRPARRGGLAVRSRDADDRALQEIARPVPLRR